MSSQIHMLSDLYEIEQTGKKVEGITILIEGAMRDILEIFRAKNPDLGSNMEIIRDALFLGLEKMRDDLPE